MLKIELGESNKRTLIPIVLILQLSQLYIFRFLELIQNIIVFSRTLEFSRKLVDKRHFEVLLINDMPWLETKLLNVLILGAWTNIIYFSVFISSMIFGIFFIAVFKKASIDYVIIDYRYIVEYRPLVTLF